MDGIKFKMFLHKEAAIVCSCVLLSILIIGSSIVGCTVYAILSLQNPYLNVADDSWQYGVILDLGSSGSRVHIYQWTDDTAEVSVPVQGAPVGHTSWMYRIVGSVTDTKRGYSKIRDDIHSLLHYAKDKLSTKTSVNISTTPLYIYGTAGFREQSKERSKMIMRAIIEEIDSNFDFLFDPSLGMIGILTPETEAALGWISIQEVLLIQQDYPLSSFTSFSSVWNGLTSLQPYYYGMTIGSMDFGGSSVEISFQVENEETERYSITERNWNGTNISIYTKGYDTYGHNDIFHAYQKEMINNATYISDDMLLDPCLLSDSYIWYDMKVERIKAKGAASIEECLDALRTVLHIRPQSEFNSEFCSIDGTAQPFVQDHLFTEFGHLKKLASFFKVPDAKQPVLSDFLNAITSVFSCSEIEAIKRTGTSDIYLIYRNTIDAFYAYLLLTEGFGFHPESNQILFDDTFFQGEEISWPLGAMTSIVGGHRVDITYL